MIEMIGSLEQANTILARAQSYGIIGSDYVNIPKLKMALGSGDWDINEFLDLIL
jgi:hypothetical protein